MSDIVRIPITVHGMHCEIVLRLGGDRDGYIDLVETDSIASADTFLGDRMLISCARWDWKERRVKMTQDFECFSSSWLLSEVQAAMEKWPPYVPHKPIESRHVATEAEHWYQAC